MAVALIGRPTRHRLLGEPVRYSIGSDEGHSGLERDDWSAHRSRWGTADLESDGDELIGRLAEARLTGHGGAHFPVVRKWESFRHHGPGGVVVGNGAEGEPLSAKDAALLQYRPHLVLDGLALAARAVGAEETILWLHDSAAVTRASVQAAIAERTSGEPVPVLRTGPPTYLAGESSALIRALSGGASLPTFQLTSGRLRDGHGRPALVHNVETLARIGLLARDIRYSTRLFTVAHRGVRTVVESFGADPLISAVRAGGCTSDLEAVLVGGYGGEWLPADEVAGRPCDEAPGAGVLLPLERGECGLRCTAAIAEYLAEAGARQCGPCQFGLPAIADALSELAESDRRRRDIVDLRRVLPQVYGRGACGHPDGAVRMVASALTVFADDVGSHLDRGRCRYAG